MAGEEGFLARWSRRKRRPPQRVETPAPAAVPAPADAAPAAAPGAALPPADLPPIDTIGADTDIRAFLAADVPADLARAALRRAWSADPAIRDFVGLSENSWDFTAAQGVPGFGSIAADEVLRLVDRAPPAAAEPPAPVTAPVAAAGSGEPAAAPSSSAPEVPATGQLAPARRRHGGAVPR